MTKVGSSPIAFGDNVRVRDTPATRMAGIAGALGSVFGKTTPSVTGVEVIGSTVDDFALNIQPAEGDGFWIALELVELIDRGAGATIVIGNKKAVRRADGGWDESEVSAGKSWWKFW